MSMSPLKRMVRFGSLEKLASELVGRFLMLERIRSLSYKVELPKKMAGVHIVFHMSHKYVHDPPTVSAPSQLEEVELESEPSSSCGPTRIVKHRVKRLINKLVMLVRVHEETTRRRVCGSLMKR